jgi:hypothetical protein
MQMQMQTRSEFKNCDRKIRNLFKVPYAESKRTFLIAQENAIFIDNSVS